LKALPGLCPICHEMQPRPTEDVWNYAEFSAKILA
jgi:hypothetical protein